MTKIVARIDAGAVRVPSGELLVVDPFSPEESRNGILVEPGAYPVFAAACDIAAEGEPDNPRIAFMTVVLDPSFSAADALEPATPGFMTEEVHEVDGIWHYECHAVAASFCDYQAFTAYETKPLETSIDDEDWFLAMHHPQQPGHIHPGIANCALTENEECNIITTSTGDSAGEFPLFYTRNAAGTITSFTVDYQMHCYSDYTDDIDDEQPGWQIEAFQPLYDQAMQLPLTHPKP